MADIVVPPMKTIILASFLLAVSCSAKVEKYVNEAIDIMEKNSVNKNDVDWVDLRSWAISEARGKKTIKETYPILNKCIQKLKRPSQLSFNRSLRRKNTTC